MRFLEKTKRSLVEKSQAMDTIGDSLIHDNLDVKSPEWHDTGSSTTQSPAIISL